MDNLSKDIQRKIALELSPYDLIHFCLANKKSYQNICDSKDFWRQKLMIDYPLMFDYFQKNNLVLKNPKNTYIRKFTENSKEIEKFLFEHGSTFSSDKEKDLMNLYHLFQIYSLNPKQFDKYKKSADDFISKYRLDKVIKNDFIKLFGDMHRKNEIYKPTKNIK